jgi:N-formylglutamate amidohydrolase
MNDIDPPFDILEPERLLTPFVFNSPHSGSVYPAAFLASSRLDPLTLRRSEDALVDRLFEGVTGLGAPLMRAHFPRAFLDVNREPYELDPKMFDGGLPNFANTRSMRVAGGLGTIARLVGEAQEIYTGKLNVDEGLARIELLYKPYHRALRRLLGRSQRAFGVVVLVDCHSMPSASLANEPTPRADIVLGDRYGTSCGGALADAFETCLRASGLFFTRNKPYAGGYITEHYGNPVSNCHAIQVEINRALYMDERSFTPNRNFAPLATLLQTTFARIIGTSAAVLSPLSNAAE